MSLQFSWPTPNVTKIGCVLNCPCSVHKGSHSGIDIVPPPGVFGDSIVAAADGKVTVTYIDYSTGLNGNGWGTYVIIEHSSTLRTVYAHCMPNSLTVKSPNQVKRGQLIAKIGSSGRSSGPHLHFEVQVLVSGKWQPRNPRDYVSPGIITPSPSPSPGVYTEPTVNLQRGSKGDGVCWVQSQLNLHGANLVVDGDFGSLTDTAVRNFQDKNCPPPTDGIVGPVTRAKLKETASPSQSYTVRVTASVLNVRTGPGTSYGVATTVKLNEVYTIVEVSNGWGKLKSGAGWISLDYTVRT